MDTLSYHSAHRWTSGPSHGFSELIRTRTLNASIGRFKSNNMSKWPDAESQTCSKAHTLRQWTAWTRVRNRLKCGGVSKGRFQKRMCVLMRFMLPKIEYVRKLRRLGAIKVVWSEATRNSTTTRGQYSAGSLTCLRGISRAAEGSGLEPVVPELPACELSTDSCVVAARSDVRSCG